MTLNWLHWIPLLPLIGAAVNLLVGRKLPRWLSAFIACAAVGAACLVAISAIGGWMFDAWARAHDVTAIFISQSGEITWSRKP